MWRGADGVLERCTNRRYNFTTCLVKVFDEMVMGEIFYG
jgi:hypothetical protein